MYVVEARDLRKTYVSRKRRGLFRVEETRVEALKGVSLTAVKGEVLGILGPNGAGKSTLVKILATLLLPDSGYARIMGFDVVSERDEVRKLIGVSLSVEKGFFYKLTGRENLKYFGMLYGLDGKALEERVNEVLRDVGLQPYADKLYEEMSLGMKARLSIARALLTDPPVLILDEPTLGLDPVSARRIRSLLTSLAHSKGKTVLVTTHNMFEAEIICDRVAIISEGRILAVDSVDSLKKRVADSVFLEIRIAGLAGLQVQNVLRNVPGVEVRTAHRKGLGDKVVVSVPVAHAEEAFERVLHELRSAGLKVRSISIVEPSLEDVFIKLAGHRVSSP
ncbi:ABC transporter ATP-binding protein [Thermofilum pendens]|uniref:ABC transporter related n=1 Tax=Thermofilum pendens (strain DSM 2475 / Hrk 5) TaxID=368408 RepID=A1RZA4_THEPD|nr:ABC transporter ATP-binding protein [Thermofilum pendens]ABL78534.1 ABC transporter related [Thermofilum pendens Hrk 5]